MTKYFVLLLVLFGSLSKAQTTNHDSLLVLGNSLINVNRDSALLIAEVVIKNSQRNATLAAAYKLKSLVLYFDGKFDSAASYLLQTLSIYENLKDSVNIGKVYNELGTLWKKQGNIQKTLDYYQKAEQIFIIKSDSVELANTYNNLGMVYEMQGNFRSAYNFYEQSLKIHQLNNSMVAIGYTYANIGGLLTTLKRYTEAEAALTKSLEIRNQLGETQNVAICYTNIAELKLAQQNYKAAIPLLQKSLQMAQQLKFVDLVRYDYQKLSECYASLQNFKDAYYNYMSYTTYNDSLFNESKTKQIAELQTKYDTEKKEQQNLFLQSENKLTALQLRKAKIQNVSLFILLLAVVGIVYLWYQRNKLKQQSIKNEAQFANERQRIQAIMQTQEDERKRISQDLHDGIGQLLSAAKLNLAATELTVQSESLHKAMHIIDDACTEVRSISHQMMPAILYKSGLANTLINQLPGFETPQLKIDLDVDDELIGYKNVVDICIYRIIQELIQNIIKHAYAQQIYISLNLKDGNLVVMIEDDGNHFDFEKIKTSNGNGWFNIKSRLEIANVLFIDVPDYFKL